MSAQRLVGRWLLASFGCVGLIVLAYYCIDRPVAYFVHDTGLNQHRFLALLGRPPEAFAYVAPLILALGLIQAWRRRLTRSWKVWLAASFSLLVSVALVLTLKFVCGRTWPERWDEPWRANNPSLIQDGVYGFHPFHGGGTHAAFPSGHMACTLAGVTVLWFGWPRGRWAYALLSVQVVVALVGMNHHFVGDVIAGGGIGWLCGRVAVHCFRLDTPEPAPHLPKQ
jgi:membrane-associated phospholipid phosphatase